MHEANCLFLGVFVAPMGLEYLYSRTAKKVVSLKPVYIWSYAYALGSGERTSGDNGGWREGTTSCGRA
jgi:hypothetical protein